MLFTIGLARPFVIHRNNRYLAGHLFLVGDLDTATIHQSDEVLGRSGEAMEQGLDLDSGLDVVF